MIRIAVCVKQVPAVSMLSFDTESRRIVREGVPNEVNPFDVLAMSAAANIKQAMPAEVVAFTMGPPQAREALVQCLAMGADRAVHLVDRAFAGSDTLATARALSLALRRDRFDLIVCGYYTVDSETGQVGPELAEMLDLPQITAVSSIEISDAGRGISVQRLTDEGQEQLYCTLPALITVVEGVAPEVYPSPEQMDSVRDRPVEVLTASELSADASPSGPAVFGAAGSPTSVSEIHSTESSREGVVIRDVPVEEAVDRLMALLEARAVFDERRADEAPRQARGVRRPRSDRGVGAIWVVAETLGGRVRPVSLELLSQARELGPKVDAAVEAVLIGHRAQDHAAELTAYGADRVHLADAPGLDRYDTELYTGVLADAITDHQPYAVLIPATVNGRDLAARLAARLGLGLTGDCIGLEIDDQGRLVQLKPAFGGSIVAPILSSTRPQMATVRPGIFTEVQPDSSVEPMISPLPLEGHRSAESQGAGDGGGPHVGGRGAGECPTNCYGGQRRRCAREHRHRSRARPGARRRHRGHPRRDGSGLDSTAAPDRAVREVGRAGALHRRWGPGALQPYGRHPEGGDGGGHQQQRPGAHIQVRRFRHPGRLRRGRPGADPGSGQTTGALASRVTELPTGPDAPDQLPADRGGHRPRVRVRRRACRSYPAERRGPLLRVVVQ